ncbi:MAG: roadblock/LC7 domain-containing protein [Thiotrichales bacterium]
MLNAILRDLNGTTADVLASAVVSTDGLVMSSVLPQSVDEDRLGAMSAALLSLGERVSLELGRGELEQVLVKGREGFVIMTHAGEDAVLTVMTRSNARLGLIFLDIKRAAQDIAGLI